MTTIGSSPYDIFINRNNTIYVPNQDTGQIIVWSEGNLTSTRNISGNLSNSSSLFMTTTGDIYIDTFYSIGGISKITSNSTINIPRMNLCQQCWDIFIDISNNLYCSLSERHQIISKSLNNDENPLEIVGGTGSAGSTSMMLNSPRGIFVGITLGLYVADCRNNRIQLFPLGKLSATTILGIDSLNMNLYLTSNINRTLFRFELSSINIDNGTSIRNSSTPIDQYQMSSDGLTSIYTDKSSSLWILSSPGSSKPQLTLFILENQTFSSMKIVNYTNLLPTFLYAPYNFQFDDNYSLFTANVEQGLYAFYRT